MASTLKSYSNNAMRERGVDIAILGVDITILGVDIAVLGVDIAVLGVDIAILGVDIAIRDVNIAAKAVETAEATGARDASVSTGVMGARCELVYT